MSFVMRIACALGFGLALAARVATAAPASPQQQIALIAKPSVLKVWGAYVGIYQLYDEKYTESIGGSGTGFFITADGYIATNAHVVANISDGDAKAKEALERILLADIEKKHRAELEKMTKARLAQGGADIRLVERRHVGCGVLPH